MQAAGGPYHGRGPLWQQEEVTSTSMAAALADMARRAKSQAAMGNDSPRSPGGRRRSSAGGLGFELPAPPANSEGTGLGLTQRKRPNRGVSNNGSMALSNYSSSTSVGLLPSIKSRSRAPSALSNKQKTLGMRSHRYTDPSSNRPGPGRESSSSRISPYPPGRGPGQLQHQRTSLGAARDDVAGEDGQEHEEGLQVAPGPEISQSMMSRLVSLPDIVCKGAAGEVYIVELSEVQQRMHRRRLGDDGYKRLQNLYKAQPSMWEKEVWKETNPYSNGRPKSGKSKASLSRRPSELELEEVHDKELDAASTSPTPGSPSKARHVQRSLSHRHHGDEGGKAKLLTATFEDLDDAVRNHLQDTMRTVEEHRRHLEYFAKGSRGMAEQQRLEAEQRRVEKTQTAMSYVINKLLPQKLVDMARMVREPVKGDSVDVFQDEPSPGASGQEGGRGTSAWSLARKKLAGTKKAVESLPFLSAWATQTKKLKAQSGKNGGWDQLFATSGKKEVAVKGSSQDNQGANSYMLKCHEIGETPSSKVAAQLKYASANMAHCKLGRRGAQALRVALAVNTAMTELNLEGNMLDAKAIAEIVKGLGQGFGIASSLILPQSSKPKQQDWLAPKARDMQVSLTPRTLQRARSGQFILDDNDQGPDGAADPTSRGSTAAGGSRPAAAGDASAKDEGTVEAGADNTEASQNPSACGADEAAVSDAVSLATSFNTKGLVAIGATCNISVLILSDNPIGIGGAKLLAGLLDPGMVPRQFLKELRLNKCNLPEAGGMDLARALHFNSTLTTLFLSNNQLGSETATLLGQALGSKSSALSFLDLSWNMIKAEGAKALCAGLRHNKSLKTLNIAWNGLEDEGGVMFGKLLEDNTGLTHLDLTNTRMGSGAAMVIASGIKVNRTLEVLMLNGNMLATDGARALMSAIKTNSTLAYLGLQGSNMSAAAGHVQGTSFNPLAPDGAYALDLANAKERAIAIQLCAMDAGHEEDLMKNIKHAGRNIPSCRSQNWPESLPVSGVLMFDFVSKRVRKDMAVIEPRKLQSLLSQLQERNASDKERLYLIEVLAPFTYFYCYQIPVVLSCFGMGSEKIEAAALLFTRAADLEDGIMELTEALTDRDLHELMAMLGWYAYLRWGNPTGHYEFALSSRVHRQFVTRLRDVAHSEDPNINNWINIVHDKYTETIKAPASFGPPEAWSNVIPTQGTLAFDYVSSVLTPPGSMPISNEQLFEFLVHVIGLDVNPELGGIQPCADMERADLQIAFLRQESGAHGLRLTCAQVLLLMRCFESSHHRVEIAVVTYSLLVDRENFWTVLYAMSSFEQGLTQWRLGPLTVFDRNHPTMHYILDMTNPAHEQVARKLVDIANNFQDFPNMWNMRLNGRKRAAAERNIWGFLTAETSTPFLEVDFIGPDALETVLGRSKADVEAMSKGERMDALTRLSRRMELSRIRDTHAYYNDGSGWQPPPWKGLKALMGALMEKPPWLAAWDRLMRMIIRYERLSPNITSDSYIEDIFDDHSNDDNEMAMDAFAACLKSWGVTKAEITQFYDGLFLQGAAQYAAKVQAAAEEEQAAAAARAAESNHALDLRSATPDADATPSTAEGGDSSAQATDSAQGRTSGAGVTSSTPAPSEDASATVRSGHAARTSAVPSIVTNVNVIDFGAFVEIFMQEAPAEIRQSDVATVTERQPTTQDGAPPLGTSGAPTGAKDAKKGKGKK